MATNPIQADRGLWFQTASGRVFYPHAPREDEIFLEDIARALSMQCRFNGHVESFYSVAEHCVLVSLRVAPVEELDVLERATSTIGKAAYFDLVHLGLVGLMHDAAEAYAGDMVSPIKHHEGMSAFRLLEDKLERCIAERFGFWDFWCGKRAISTRETVKEADRRLLLTEKRDLRKPSRQGLPAWSEEEAKLLPYDDMKIRGESPERAEELFRLRFAELWKRKTGGIWMDEDQEPAS